MATIPEQYGRLEQYIQDQNKIEKPLLSEDQIENINDTLASKMIDNTVLLQSKKI
ncbi:YolD-like family protein [Staphylococcus equorum]|uniref:YolD-like family protein n=1 Tax=Staphylococcus equorum TaxID=246432 RepID=UPI0034E5C650